MKRALAAMLFLHYFALGALFPVLSLLLFRDLGFTAAQTGIVIGVGALASIVAPLVALPLADRSVAAERLLGLLNLGSVGLTVAMALRDDFWSWLGLYLALMMTKAPSFALTNSVALKYLADPTREFARVRLFGTAGWIAGGLGYSLVFQPLVPHLGYRGCLWLSAVGSMALATLSFLLPRGRPLPFAWGEFTRLIHPRRLSLLLRRPFPAFLWASLVLSALDRYYFFGVNFQLATFGLPEPLFLPLLSLGQALEIAFMLRVGSWLEKVGFGPLFLVGAAGQALRFAVLGTAGNLPLLLGGIALHGLGFAFFFSNAFVYLDRLTPPSLRSQVQLLYSFWIDGAAVILGNLAAGWVASFTLFPAQGRYDFPGYWIWALAAAASALGALALEKFPPPGQQP